MTAHEAAIRGLAPEARLSYPLKPHGEILVTLSLRFPFLGIKTIFAETVNLRVPYLKEISDAPKPKGRPRSHEAHVAILKAALSEVHELGFRAVSIDSLSVKSGVAKTTIYRRWPNKAAVVMDAFFYEIGPEIAFPPCERSVDSIQIQMRAVAKAFRGKFGPLIKALLGEAQFDPELAEAFRDRWIEPRRETAKTVIRDAIRKQELRSDIDLDTTIDALYGGLYYRLLIGAGPLSQAYVDDLFHHVMDGLRPGSRNGSRQA
jgi:AcrR family transcriptional regulator